MSERIRIALVCEECQFRNYQTTKARRSGQEERFALKKYCPKCLRHTIHQESK